MPFTLNQALEQVRRELGDTDAANARWSADDLEQHLRHALEAVSLVLPREERAELLTTAGSREVSIQTLADRIAVEAVEYPAGNYPATYTASRSGVIPSACLWTPHPVTASVCGSTGAPCTPSILRGALCPLGRSTSWCRARRAMRRWSGRALLRTG